VERRSCLRQAALLFGRGLRAGFDRKLQKQTSVAHERELIAKIRKSSGVAETDADRADNRAALKAADNYEEAYFSGGGVGSLGDAESPLGDAKSSLGDAESSLGDAKSSLGDATSSLGDAESSLGDAESSLSGAESSLGDAKSSLGDA
jgi:hypothetical protein